MGWSLQLADGLRVVIPDFLPPPWSWVGSSFDVLVLILPKLVPRPSDDVVEGVEEELTVSNVVSVGLELIPMQVSEPIVAEPLSLICPLIEDNHSTIVDTTRIGFYQNSPSAWVMVQMKEFREMVGASYEGYEAEVMALLQKIELQRPQ
jgi:hypothetical protein